MEKFSLYDFLGLLLPGVIFLFFFNLIIKLSGINLFAVFSFNLETDIIILLCFALIIGAILYASNFYLLNESTLYNKLFGMYKHVADLYLTIKSWPESINKTLNKKAVEWYEKNIFFDNKDFNKKSDLEKAEIKKLQDEFYDRIYYELEYHGKNEHLKAFQSFYFFFRQTALSCLLLLFTDGLIFLITVLLSQKSDVILVFNIKIFYVTIILLFLLIISVLLARWYRKRMVMKIYWAYFTHLQLTSN